MDRRPKRSSRRKFQGQPCIVVSCAIKDCPISIPATVAFCPRHLKEVFALLEREGLLREHEELMPVALRPRPRTW